MAVRPVTLVGLVRRARRARGLQPGRQPGRAARRRRPTTADPLRATVEVTEVDDILGDLDVPWGLAFLPDGQAVVTLRDAARLVLVGPDGAATDVTGPGADELGGPRRPRRRGRSARASPCSGRRRVGRGPGPLRDRGRRQPGPARHARRVDPGRAAADPHRHREGGQPRRRPARRRPGRLPLRDHGRRGRPAVGAGPGQPQRQDPAHHGRRRPRARATPTRARRCGASGTATCRGSAGRPTGGCSPRSSARTRGTSST